MSSSNGYVKLTKCRLCGNSVLKEVLDLGIQSLTGVFPKDASIKIDSGPLILVKCYGDKDCCGLLQLAHSFDSAQMYGDNYGYRSGLNKSMVEHLKNKVLRIQNLVNLSDESIVVDIGSNDGTTLAAYTNTRIKLVGIDPTAGKFIQFYPKNSSVIPTFFTSSVFREHFNERRAAVVTSFSMFYDLEAPLVFASEVASILDINGIWVLEQSYMPLMLARNSFDTVCHEHLEYYAVRQIDWIAKQSNMKILDIEFNDINGGSFSVTMAREESKYPEFAGLSELLEKERAAGLDTLAPYQAFAAAAETARDRLREFVSNARSADKRVACLGASTKGNVLLQYCGFTSADLEAVGEVNPDKYGCLTPGTMIPIISETDLLINEPDYLIVLPWHFRKYFLDVYRLKKARLVFPLPELEIVDAIGT